jgi:hypothetical protein
MVLRESGVAGLLLFLATVAAMLGRAVAGPDLDVLMIGKSYAGRAYGTPDSTGQTGSVFEGYSLKVRFSEALDCDRLDIVSGDSAIGEVHVLNDKITGLLTFRKSMPGSPFHLYRWEAPPRPESIYTAYLPLWPERKWLWRPEGESKEEERRWKPQNYIGTYVVEPVDTDTPWGSYAIRQVEGDDPE